MRIEECRPWSVSVPPRACRDVATLDVRTRVRLCVWRLLWNRYSECIECFISCCLRMGDDCAMTIVKGGCVNTVKDA